MEAIIPKVSSLDSSLVAELIALAPIGFPLHTVRLELDLVGHVSVREIKYLRHDTIPVRKPKSRTRLLSGSVVSNFLENISATMSFIGMVAGYFVLFYAVAIR